MQPDYGDFHHASDNLGFFFLIIRRMLVRISEELVLKVIGFRFALIITGEKN